MVKVIVEICSAVIASVQASLTYAATITNFAPTMPFDEAFKYGSCVAKASSAWKVRPTLVLAVIQKESQWRPCVVSKTNDFGLGQLHRTNPTKEQRKALLDGCSNIFFTTEFLATRGLAAYNPGSPRHRMSVLRIERKLNRKRQTFSIP